ASPNGTAHALRSEKPRSPPCPAEPVSWENSLASFAKSSPPWARLRIDSAFALTAASSAGRRSERRRGRQGKGRIDPQARPRRRRFGELREIFAALGALEDRFGLCLDGRVFFRIGDLQQDVAHVAALRL